MLTGSDSELIRVDDAVTYLVTRVVFSWFRIPIPNFDFLVSKETLAINIFPCEG